MQRACGREVERVQTPLEFAGSCRFVHRWHVAGNNDRLSALDAEYSRSEDHWHLLQVLWQEEFLLAGRTIPALGRTNVGFFGETQGVCPGACSDEEAACLAVGLRHSSGRAVFESRIGR